MAPYRKSPRRNIERHLPDCTTCVSRVGLLTRDWYVSKRDPADNRSGVAENWKKAVPSWAAAAINFPRRSAISPVPTCRNPAPSVRTPITIDQPGTYWVDSSLHRRSQQAIDGNADRAGRLDLIIRWTERTGHSLYYEVRVVTDVGDLVGTKRINGTEWITSGELQLESDREYFVRVDAFLSGAKPVSSPFVSIRVQDR